MIHAVLGLLFLTTPYERNFKASPSVQVTFQSPSGRFGPVNVVLRRKGKAHSRSFRFENCFGGHDELVGYRFAHSKWFLLGGVTNVDSAAGTDTAVWAIDVRALSCRLIMTHAQTIARESLCRGYIVEQTVARWAQNPPRRAAAGDWVRRVHRFNPETGRFLPGPWHIEPDGP